MKNKKSEINFFKKLATYPWYITVCIDYDDIGGIFCCIHV